MKISNHKMDNEISNELIKKTINDINHNGTNKLRIMEVCGTHTQIISQTGIKSMLPSNINLTSGPGCPVCVTHESYIDAAIYLLNNYNVLLATFGDMLCVKGTRESLMDQTYKRKNIVVLYSPLDAIELAQNNNDKQVVFFSVGFETTAPLIALAAKIVHDNNMKKISFLTSLKLMPPILHKILKIENNNINGIICPGHVAAIKGSEYFKFIPQDYNIPAVVCGFNALDIVSGLYYLIKQYNQGDSKSDNYRTSFKNLYKTCVSENGNIYANQLIDEVFQIDDSMWRGIGQVKNSSLELKGKYSCYDALKRFNINLNNHCIKQKCNCSNVLLGDIFPNQCSLFGKICNPQNPKGPCMVSREGACYIYHIYVNSTFDM